MILITDITQATIGTITLRDAINRMITLTISTELQGLSSLTTTGIVFRTGTGTYITKSITADMT